MGCEEISFGPKAMSNEFEHWNHVYGTPNFQKYENSLFTIFGGGGGGCFCKFWGVWREKATLDIFVVCGEDIFFLPTHNA